MQPTDPQLWPHLLQVRLCCTSCFALTCTVMFLCSGVLAALFQCSLSLHHARSPFHNPFSELLFHPSHRECVVDTLEGPGIVKSQCPTCRQPAWKKELKTNHKYLALADTTAQLTALLQQQGNAGSGAHASVRCGRRRSQQTLLLHLVPVSQAHVKALPPFALPLTPSCCFCCCCNRC